MILSAKILTICVISVLFFFLLATIKTSEFVTRLDNKAIKRCVLRAMLDNKVIKRCVFKALLYDKATKRYVLGTLLDNKTLRRCVFIVLLDILIVSSHAIQKRITVLIKRISISYNYFQRREIFFNTI